MILSHMWKKNIRNSVYVNVCLCSTCNQGPRELSRSFRWLHYFPAAMFLYHKDTLTRRPELCKFVQKHFEKYLEFEKHTDLKLGEVFSFSSAWWSGYFLWCSGRGEVSNWPSLPTGSICWYLPIWVWDFSIFKYSIFHEKWKRQSGEKAYYKWFCKLSRHGHICRSYLA